MGDGYERQVSKSTDRKRFASANGWRRGKRFSLDLLIRNSHLDRRHLDKYGYHLNASDHSEYFRVAGKPIAIVAHNYEMDVEGATRLPSFCSCGPRLTLSAV